jgi:hypothetical protein
VGEFHPQVKNYLPLLLPTKGGATARHLLKNIYKKLQDLRIIPKIEINEKNDYNIKEVVGELVKRNIFLNFLC